MTDRDQTRWRVTAFSGSLTCSGVALSGTSPTKTAARLDAADTALAALIELSGIVCLSITVGDQFAITLVDTGTVSPDQQAGIVVELVAEQLPAGGQS